VGFPYTNNSVGPQVDLTLGPHSQPTLNTFAFIWRSISSIYHCIPLSVGVDGCLLVVWCNYFLRIRRMDSNTSPVFSQSQQTRRSARFDDSTSSARCRGLEFLIKDSFHHFEICPGKISKICTNRNCEMSDTKFAFLSILRKKKCGVCREVRRLLLNCITIQYMFDNSH
jgi:hypothetical protein